MKEKSISMSPELRFAARISGIKIQGCFVMRYGKIAGEKISRFILGTDVFGSSADQAAAFELMDIFASAGGNALDSARLYSGGKSEETVGRWISERRRPDINVITKCAHPDGRTMHTGRLSASEIDADVKKSLEFLPRIDFLLLHRDDTERPVGGIMETLQGWIESGRVKHIGASNWTLARILEANLYACGHGLTPFSLSEIAWSLAESTPAGHGDDTIVCMSAGEKKIYAETSFPVLAYGSQGKGFFTKLNTGSVDARLTKRYLTTANINRAEKLYQAAYVFGLSPSAAAAAYITSNDANGFAIIGCKNPAHLRDTLTAADVCYDRGLAAQLELGRG